MTPRPPRSTLALLWQDYNGCRETSPYARRNNARLAPLNSFSDFALWLSNLSASDRSAWAESVGWPELTNYWTQGAWLMNTAWPSIRRIAKSPEGGAA